MGHHYVPRHYLRNFEDGRCPGFLWMFDKASGGSRHMSISRAAQEARFYEPEIEVVLNTKVERPANPVVGKLLRKQCPTAEEKSHLALYIAVMLMRVPFRRRRLLESFPQVLHDVTTEFRDGFTSLIGQPEFDQAAILERLAQIDAIREKYNREPPPAVIQQIRDPRPPRKVFMTVREMTWRVLEASGPSFFMTCDNPVFFFRDCGLKSPEAELCFPLSTRYAVHGSWQKARTDIVFLVAPELIVKEINRRLASTTERFAFYHERARWVEEILCKNPPDLQRIRW